MEDIHGEHHDHHLATETAVPVREISATGPPAGEQEINESLSEIYQDESGKMADVTSITKKKRRGFFYYFFLLIILGILTVGGYFLYDYILSGSFNSENIGFEIISQSTETVSGELKEYEITVDNSELLELHTAEVKVSFPENFVFLESQPRAEIASGTKNNIWQLGRILPSSKNTIKIKGRIIGKKGDTAGFVSELRFKPENMSLEYKKESSLEVVIADTGLDISLEALSSVLVGEQSELSLSLKPKDRAYLDKLRLELSLPSGTGLALLPYQVLPDQKNIVFSKDRPNEWLISGLAENEASLKIPFAVKSKSSETGGDSIGVKAFYSDEKTGKQYLIDERQVVFNVIKSGLNLSLVINGSREDQGVNFGDKLTYSIAYSNKGDTDMKDVVIMAVVEGGLADFASLKDAQNGELKDNSITWTKNEIPGLATVTPGTEGMIDLTLNVLKKENAPKDRKFELKSYAQFSIGNLDRKTEDTKSNVIVNKINSALEFSESLRYFNDDNIAVGSGPIPPKVGEATVYRAYWSVGGNTHELDECYLEAILPPYVTYADKAVVNVGEVEYSESEHKITWKIGKIPLLSEPLKAEFGISFAPKEEDRNKIIVLLPGTKFEGKDTETGAQITQTQKAETTRLDDDEIGKGDGRIQ